MVDMKTSKNMNSLYKIIIQKFPARTATGKDSRPCFWHLPLPLILPANQSNGKSQTHASHYDYDVSPN